MLRGPFIHCCEMATQFFSLYGVILQYDSLAGGRVAGEGRNLQSLSVPLFTAVPFSALPYLASLDSKGEGQPLSL